MKISLEETEQLLLSGEVAAVPTETVYGLAASIHSPSAIEKVYTLKKRPSDNPLIVHVASMEQALTLAVSPSKNFEKLASAFWPGPLTIVISAVEDLIPQNVRCGLKTVGIRVPNHPLTLELIKRVGPIVAPSANLSGAPSSTSPEHVESDFGKNFPVLDGGVCTQGVESTIVTDEGELLREGAISRERFAEILTIKQAQETAIPRCPGQKYRHYSPKARLLSGSHFRDIAVGFEEREYPFAKQVYRLGSLHHPEEIAHNLYEILRRLDQDHVKEAWIDLDFPQVGLLRTVYERLIKASSH